MKKISALVAILMGIALIVGCSNDSDGGSAVFGPVLPASDGTNQFSGKTFSAGDVDTYGKTTYVFNGATGTKTYERKYPAVTGVNTEYTEKDVQQFSYSYNSKTQALYILPTSSVTYITRNGATVQLPKQRAITSDADFVSICKERTKLYSDLLSDEYLNAAVKSARYSIFAKYGYTDTEGATELSAEVINKCNEGQAAVKKLVRINAYELNGSTLKIVSDYRIPSGLKFSQIYGCYDVDIEVLGTIPASISAGNDPYEIPNIVYYNGSTPSYGRSIASVLPGSIVINKKASYSSANGGVWTYTSESKTYNYLEVDANTVSASIASICDLAIEIENLGYVGFVYAKSTNVPSFSGLGVPTYTQE